MHLCREDERLKSFDDWPLPWLSKVELAMSGLYYLGDEDRTKCYFCQVEIGRWERGDEPVAEHLRWSPNCPLLRRRPTGNVPLDCEALHRILPVDICGSGIAEFPEYSVESDRVRSFLKWPMHMKQTPVQLAKAGFFYTGVGDRVICFSCGGGLKDWDRDDDPWEQHSRWMKNCRFVKLMKGDELPDGGVSLEHEKLCKVCYVHEYNTAFLPCGHVVACAKCALSVVKCPLCRNVFADVMRVYFS